MSGDGGTCERCGGTDFFLDDETGELICLGCGLVISRKRVVPHRRPEIVERKGTAKTSEAMKRLMTIDRRIRVDNGEVYGLRMAMKEIKRLTQIMHLPDVITETAEEIYRRAQRRGLILRGTIIGFSAAAVYAACRVMGLPRTLREVSEFSAEDVKEVARMYRILVTELGISVELDNPLKHLTRIAQSVGLSHEVEVFASRILLEAMGAGYHVGKSPEGVAASALYLACNMLDEPCTQKALGEVSGVSQLTIRKHVKGLTGAVDIDRLRSANGAPPP